MAAWRLGFRWFLWGSGKALLGLSAVAAVALVFMGLRWGWLAAQARWADPLPLPSSPAPAPAPVAPPAAAPDPRRSFPLRLDESEPTTAPKRAAAGAQSPAPRNTEAQRP